jgi:hypothetical protein
LKTPSVDADMLDSGAPIIAESIPINTTHFVHRGE